MTACDSSQQLSQDSGSMDRNREDDAAEGQPLMALSPVKFTRRVGIRTIGSLAGGREDTAHGSPTD